MIRLVLVGTIILALASGAYLLGRTDGPAQPQASISVAEALGGPQAAGFARATAPRQFVFPADHGPHPAYRSEWWYFTGNLDTPDGRHFGFELTFFRIGLSAQPVQRQSDWATQHVYMAHFAVTDAAGQRFYAFERFSRAALGLAGAQAEPLRIWLEDWSAEGIAEAGLPLRLQAAEGEVAIDLTLESAKPVVLQGERGLSQKGPEPGNASYYYSLTRMPTSGTLRIEGQSYQVSGLSWMDREWSTSSLGAGQVGWDWFALQLDDGREIMYYQLREQDGGVSPFSSGTLVRADGSLLSLGPGDVQLEVLEHWQSPRSGTRYPARWRLRLPAEALDLELQPYLADQELDVSVRYWEGAVRLRGSAAGQPMSGSGYVELTGYEAGASARR